MSRKKNLIYIPFQDMYNFMNEGILTREYAIYHYLHTENVNFRLFINKPRTWLSRKIIKAMDDRFPIDSLERNVRDSITSGDVMFLEKPFDIREIMYKRSWWPEAYMMALEQIQQLDWNWGNTVVYSNNPYAYRLIMALKEMGARILFDAMDNLCTFPHIKSNERETAFRGYGEMARISDFFSCNSKRTQDFMREYFGREPVLIKNGVFEISEKQLEAAAGIDHIQIIRKKKTKYKKVLGYIGKFGPKMDIELIKTICSKMPDVLYVLVGFDVMRNGSFTKAVSGIDNLVCLPGISSAYIYAVMKEFDILTIPYMVGKNENSGDPLKLYQYMMMGKPIITQPIREVDEYKKYIHILSGAEEWIHCISDIENDSCNYDDIIPSFLWEERLRPMLDVYNSI